MRQTSTMSAKQLRSLIAMFVLATLPASAAEMRVPRSDTALPDASPVQPSAYAPALDEQTATGSIGALDGLATGRLPQQATSGAELKAALDSLEAGDAQAAIERRDALPTGSLDRQTLTFALATEGGALASHQILAAMKELAGWPGHDVMRRNLERALYRERAPADAVLHELGDGSPLTLEGRIVLARALLASDETEAARMLIAPYWRSAKLEAAQEASILREFGPLLSKADHRARMVQMLHLDRPNSSLRIASEAGLEEIAKAWTAVIRRQADADKLLDAVPEVKRSDAAYIFAKARHLRWSGDYREAAKVMLTAPTDAAELVDPDAWWIERRVLSRELLDLGDVATAYRLAAAHAAESPLHAVDAEFHAGWYALQGMRDAPKAKAHFARIVEIAEGPISLARGHYWLGRAIAAAGGDPTQEYERAAHYGTTFYGQIAAAKLGRTVLAADPPAPSAEDRLAFEARPAVQAIRRLEAAGQSGRTGLLYRSLAAELPRAGEIALLARMAEARGDNMLALRVAKGAAARGVEVGGLTHPTGAIPEAASISGAGKALAYAIARQESEFNASAVSSAGARGLLQLLPGTARAMAKHAGLAYSQERLTSDPAYNATLGAAYLSEQLARFDGSYVLTFAGYNAGPRRAQEWVQRYGDPRGKDIDTIVDWIERIPYHETRSYVQRVMENYQVYKMRLSGRFDIATDLSTGR